MKEGDIGIYQVLVRHEGQEVDEKWRQQLIIRLSRICESIPNRRHHSRPGGSILVVDARLFEG
jgi:hypothetical protein